jgi:hypothetical protein
MKSADEVYNLLERGETHNCEFKREFEPEKIVQTLVAFANDWPEVGGGTLLIGVDDKKHTPIGLKTNLDEIQKKVANVCTDTTVSPSISPIIYPLTLGGTDVIVVEVSRADRLPCQYRKNGYIRVGTTTRKATFEEELTLYERSKRDNVLRPLQDKLPPREEYAFRFIGRQGELEELWSWFKDTRERRRALSGDGGKGKTAIAYEFACHIADASPEGYDMVLWSSAKTRQFKQGGIFPIAAPDFWDLESFLNKILVDMGFPEEQEQDLNAKKDKAIELLETFSSLLVVDDIDSLNWRTNADLVDFITFRIPNTKCKVLVTSRRELAGMPTIFVGGFNDEDGQKFIRSRLKLAGMDSNLLGTKEMRQILQVTDSSPLYIEALLRYFKSTGELEATVQMWRDKGGDAAREYALKRELEMVSDDARFVLCAFCYSDGPSSLAEAKATTGFSVTRLESAISDLQQLFLVPRPSIAEGIPRFSVNYNTRSLVLSVMKGSKELEKVTLAIKSMTGDVYHDRRRRATVSGFITQATGLIRNKSYTEAESTIKKGLRQLNEDPDLLGALGWVYKCWVPRRITDAREQFQRSAELKCKNMEAYKHWYEMEEEEKNWDGIVKASEAALSVFKKNNLWTFRYGYALSRYGQHLASQFQPRASTYLIKADRVLNPFLEVSEMSSDSDFKDLHWTICRALALNAAQLYKLSTKDIKDKENKEKEKWLARLAEILRIWLVLHGDEHSTQFEVEKISIWYPDVRAKMKECV